MPLTVVCPRCSRGSTVSDALAGTTIPCSYCGFAINVPVVHPTPAPAPSGRACEDCGAALTEDNYGGWAEDYSATHFKNPTRFYLCRACCDAREAEEAAEEAAKRERQRRGAFIGLVVGGVIITVAITVWLVSFLTRPDLPPSEPVQTQDPRPNAPAEEKPGAKAQPLEIAPPPTPVLAFPPPPGYVSEWKRVGAVEVRVSGVAVARVPTTDLHNRPSESVQPVLAIWIEARADATGRKVEFQRWQGLGADSRLVRTNGVEVLAAQLGAGHSLRTGLPWTQAVVPGGKARAGILVYSVPERGSGDLVLILNAERVGEVGTFSLPVPQIAYAP